MSDQESLNSVRSTEEASASKSYSDDWEAALAEQAEDQRIARASYDRFEKTGANERSRSEDLNLDVILDVPVTLSVEIGRNRINIRDLLQLNPGSVVELDRLAGELMDVMVNGTLIARGEVVVVNDKFGIRLTDIISPQERVRRLR